MSGKTSYPTMMRGEGKQTPQLLTLQHCRACTEYSTCTTTETCELLPEMKKTVCLCSGGPWELVHACMSLCASLTFIVWHRWYTQQNPPRARTYSWSRNPRPGLDPQQRPGSAPLYGRLCYGIHTLPVLRDYPAGPLEAGLQLTQLTHELTRSQIGNSLLFPNQSTLEPLLGSSEMSSGCYEAERTAASSKITHKNEGSEINTADTKENQNQGKVRIYYKQMTRP